MIFSVERSRWVLLEQCLLKRCEGNIILQEERLRTGIFHDRGSGVHNDYVVHLLVRELREMQSIKREKVYALTSKRDWLRRVGHCSHGQDQAEPGRLDPVFNQHTRH